MQILLLFLMWVLTQMSPATAAVQETQPATEPAAIITADEARKRTNELRDTQTQALIAELSRRIGEAADQGRTSIILKDVPMHLQTGIIKYFEARGFRYERGWIGRITTPDTLHWDKKE